MATFPESFIKSDGRNCVSVAVFVVEISMADEQVPTLGDEIDSPTFDEQ